MQIDGKVHKRKYLDNFQIIGENWKYRFESFKHRSEN